MSSKCDWEWDGTNLAWANVRSSGRRVFAGACARRWLGLELNETFVGFNLSSFDDALLLHLMS